ncbi:DsbA family protein [Herminiimonas arsenitoxidans]|uniref:DsbA family protein n=1 Tax=Herminiimonas arsenitoxidans TaxID=1809410 RepID=UPI0009713542|nr:DsbA family protein [Herminiimonas arsenitoxidans]
MSKLIYIADPMCSWCYGFGPELVTLINGLPDTPLEIIVGGLRAYNTEVMDEELKATLLSHWKKVEEVSGLPFSKDGLSHAGFVYDTEPACRAVVAAGILAPDTALNVFHAIQHAFYAEALDTTKGEVLAKIGADVISKAGIKIDAAAFLATWSSEEAIAATHADFSQTKRWGVSGFPTLVLEKNGELHLVTSGYTKTETLVDRLQALIDQPA